MAQRLIEQDLPTHERRLDNGLTVLVREVHAAPVVAIVTHVKAGYFDEPDPLVGISHVLEHMYFKGTERRGVGAMARETKAAGGYLNAGTIYDHTSYYSVLPASSLEMGLDIQADALRNSQIHEDELRRELEVIIQEAKRKLDNPAAVAVESLYETMFDVHRMRRWRIGTEAGLRELTRGHVWDYYRSLYHPSNIVLVVAGDVDPGETFALVERHYGDMEAGTPLREPGPEEPERRGFRLREISGDILQSYAELGWRTPGTLHPDTAVLDLLAVVLGQGRASRLYRGVREKGWVSGISADNYTPTDIGVFNIGAELAPGDTLDALRATAAEVERVRREPVSAEELQRAKNILEARMVRRLETVEGQANLLAEWQALGDWRLADRYLERILEADAEEVRRAAERYLSLDALTVLVYRPASAPPLGMTAEALERDLAQAPPPAETSPAPRGASMAEPDTGSVRLPRPARVEDEVHFYELDGGARLAVLPRHASPLVSMSVSFPGGVLDETPETAGLTGLMARVSVKGTESRSAAELAEATESLGGAVSPSVTSDLLSWSLSLPSRHFQRGFELLSDVVLRPAFPADELERERKITLSDLAQVQDDMYRYPMHLFYEGAFRGHPYGLGLDRMEKVVARVEREEVRLWHRRLIEGSEPWVFVVGDVEPDAVAQTVATRLAGLHAGSESAARPHVEWPAAPVEESARREKAQTALVMGFPGPDRNDPDVYALQVLANAVSGLGGRLFEELRDKRSLAYTVAAYPVARWRGGAFVSYIATSPEREEEARRTMLAELERLRDVPIDEDDLDRSRRYTIGTWQIRSQTNGARLSDLAHALMLGGGLAELREFEDRIREVTQEQVQEAARRHFDSSRLVEGVVRGTGGAR